MKILILPDVHNRWELVEKIIKSVNPNQTILLGDFFDDFNDDPHIIADVADWFHESINRSNRIHICGNHDIQYWWKDNTEERCGGYSQPKSIVINDFVKPEDWKKLVFYYILDNKWLLSHGGLHPYWFNPTKYERGVIPTYSLNYLKRRLASESNECLKCLGRKQWHWFTIPGFGRSNHSPYYGGLLWCDYTREFEPIRGIHQIMGHTPKVEQFWTIVGEGEDGVKDLPIQVGAQDWNLTPNSSFNVCLDSVPGSKYYAIYEDGKLSIFETADLK